MNETQGSNSDKSDATDRLANSFTLDNPPIHRTLVFCNTVAAVESAARFLRLHNVTCDVIHKVSFINMLIKLFSFKFSRSYWAKHDLSRVSLLNNVKPPFAALVRLGAHRYYLPLIWPLED